MLHIALQTRKGIVEMEAILKEHGFESLMSDYDEGKDMIYAASFIEPFETPKTLDMFDEEEIVEYLKNECGREDCYEDDFQRRGA